MPSRNNEELAIVVYELTDCCIKFDKIFSSDN
jgi:hypothetical protein